MIGRHFRRSEGNPSSTPTVRRVVVSLLLALSLVGLGWGFSLSRTSNSKAIYNNPAVKDLFPKPGDDALQQTRVEVTLGSEYALAQESSPGMTINQVGIPQDEIEFVPGLNEYTFTPGPGKLLTLLPVGRICTRLMIRQATDLSDPGSSFVWCFNAS